MLAETITCCGEYGIRLAVRDLEVHEEWKEGWFENVRVLWWQPKIETLMSSGIGSGGSIFIAHALHLSMTPSIFGFCKGSPLERSALPWQI